MKKILSILLFIISVPFSLVADPYLSIATFNVQWLGDGENDSHKRSETDYKNIAEIIRNCNSGIVALQEIENNKAIERLLPYLPAYSYYVVDGVGSQNIAFLFDTSLTVKIREIYSPIQLGHSRYRPGLIADVKAGNFDFVIMAVHLKASSNYEKTESKRQESIDNRTKQNAVLSIWIDSSLTSSKEQDYIILGDFNDSPNNSTNTFSALSDNSNVVILTNNLHGNGKFEKRYSVDHVIVSRSAADRYISGSACNYDFSKNYPKEQLKNISDHSPVIVKFDINKPDND